MREMPRADQLAVMVSLAMLGLALSLIVVLPVRGMEFTLLGSQLALEISGRAQVAIAVVGLVASGTDAIIQAHPLNRRRSLAFSVAFWALPSAVALAGLALVGEFTWWGYRLATIFLCGGLLAGTVALQYHTIAPDDPLKRGAKLALDVLTYAVALLFFIFIYGSRLRSIISASSVILVSAVLAIELLRDSREAIERAWFYSGVVALILGELTWALNYSPLEPRLGGGLLLLAFYLLTGLVRHHLAGEMSRRVLAEYLAVAGAATILIVAAAVRL